MLSQEARGRMVLGKAPLQDATRVDDADDDDDDDDDGEDDDDDADGVDL